MSNSDYIVHFAGTVGLFIDTTRAPAWNVVHLRTDTLWEEARVVIAELLDSKRFVLSMHHTLFGTAVFNGSPGLRGQSLTEFFAKDWCLAEFSESERVIHWHGSGDVVDFRMIFETTNDARRFLQVFLGAVSRVVELEKQDRRVLGALLRPLFENAMEGHVDV
ncbi:hypothetical protein FKP32DRAFT_1670832 [Trametes sanguinea]|nr:hypothetical protein FKP32DRAFT_1670832 [Trametes sanguinea]